MKKQFLNRTAIAVFGTLLLLTVGSAAVAQNDVTITYWLAGGVGGSLSDDKQELVAEFEAANPGINVEVEVVPFAQYDQQSQTNIVAQEGPDVLEVNSVSMGQFTSRGLLRPIDDLLAESAIGGEQFYDGAWESVQFQGRVWGLPLDTGTRLILYNLDLFEEAGVEPFGETVNWEQMLAAAEAVNNPAESVYGFGYIGGERWQALYEGIGHFLVQSDVYLIDDEGNVQVDTSGALETLAFYQNLTQYSPPDAVNWNILSEVEQRFADGQIGMYLAGWWSLDQVLAANEDINFGLSKPGKEVYGSPTGGWIVSIPRHLEGEKLEASWKFIEFLFEPEHNAKWTDLVSNQPASPNLKLTAERYEPYLEILPNSRHPLPLVPELPQLAEAIMVETQRMILGESTPQEAQEATGSEFRSILD